MDIWDEVRGIESYKQFERTDLTRLSINDYSVSEFRESIVRDGLQLLA